MTDTKEEQKRQLEGGSMFHSNVCNGSPNFTLSQFRREQLWCSYQVLRKSIFFNVAIFWDIAPRSAYVNRRFGRTYQFHSA
jgi:hypothetical protein